MVQIQLRTKKTTRSVLIRLLLWNKPIVQLKTGIIRATNLTIKTFLMAVLLFLVALCVHLNNISPVNYKKTPHS